MYTSTKHSLLQTFEKAPALQSLDTLSDVRIKAFMSETRSQVSQDEIGFLNLENASFNKQDRDYKNFVFSYLMNLE
jgi:hypothetical protein